MVEAQVEEKDWDIVTSASCDKEAVQEISVKLHNVLLALTTGDANAVVSRCRGNGFWAWKTRISSLNPRTLTSGVKAISQVLSPSKIINGPNADSVFGGDYLWQSQGRGEEHCEIQA